MPESVCLAQIAGSAKVKGGDEIAPFRLTGPLEGSVVLRYTGDENLTSGPAIGAQSRSKQSGLSEEVTLSTRGYIYHPNLLVFEIGGGPVLDQSENTSEAVLTKSSRQMYNLNAQLTVLREKPYTGSLFFNHQNDTQIVGPAQSMQTENTRYGFNFNLKEPVIRFPLQMELERSQNSGSSVEQSVDDSVDRFHLTLDVDLDKLGWNSFIGNAFSGTSAFQFDNSKRNSSSGATNLPIQASVTYDDRANLNTRLKFGPENIYELANTITLHNSSFSSNQGPITNLNDSNFALDLRGRYSEDFQTNGHYSYNSSQQGEQTLSVNTVSAGMSYQWTPELAASLNGRGERSLSTQLSSTALGLDGSLQWRHTVGPGQLTASHSLSYSERDQQASSLQTKVFDEHITLTGNGFSMLTREQVDIASVVVSNLTRSQVYVAGLDYVLTPLGLNTRIQRQISGNILDGQELLIDYAYATGGTYALSQLDQTFSLGWSYKNNLNVTARYSKSSPQLISGISTSPLNPGHSTAVSAHLEYPLVMFSEEFIVGGNAERENRREVILPFQRMNSDIYVQTGLPFFVSGSLRLGKRLQRVDYDDVLAQGSNITAYDLRLSARSGIGVVFSLESTLEQDTGLAVASERSATAIKARWRRAKLQASLELSRVHESQGTIDKVRTVGQFILQRKI